jgi:heme exporter protein A
MSDHDQLNIENLAFTRENHCFFKNLNLTLRRGEILQICGENGSGKSTLLRILAGLLTPEEGKITWNQLCIFNENDIYKKIINYLGHKNALKPYLTVQENLKLAEALQSKSMMFAEIIEKCEIKHLLKRTTHQLSAGQLRRISFARILLNPKKIWLLDEPMTSLDQKAQEWLACIFTEHLQQSGIIIIATHQQLALPYPVKQIALRGIDID